MNELFNNIKRLKAEAVLRLEQFNQVVIERITHFQPELKSKLCVRSEFDGYGVSIWLKIVKEKRVVRWLEVTFSPDFLFINFDLVQSDHPGSPSLDIRSSERIHEASRFEELFEKDEFWKELGIVLNSINSFTKEEQDALLKKILSI